MNYCINCGTNNPDNVDYCEKCGESLPKRTRDKKEEIRIWPQRLGLIIGIWGIINFIVTSTLIGGILLFFAVLIYASRNKLAIYSFGIVWMLIAILQLIIGASITFTDRGILLLVFGVINLLFGGWVIYNTKTLDTINDYK